MGYPAKKALKEISVAIGFIFIAFVARWLVFFYYNSPDKPVSIIFSKLVGPIFAIFLTMFTIFLLISYTLLKKKVIIKKRK